MHYYKFNIADWTLHTAHLTPEEEGVYFRLVNFYYDTESPIPEKTQSVMRRLRLGNNSEIVGIILDEFFYLQDGFWHHKRCDSEIAAYRAQADKNRANGKRGGRPRGSKDSKPRAKKNPKTQWDNSGNPNITLTNNHKPLTNNKNTMSGKPDLVEIADRVIEELNRRAGKHFRLTKNNRNAVIARLRDGFTEQDCYQVIANRCQKWLGTEQSEYLRPDTLFRPSKFEGYLNDTGGTYAETGPGRNPAPTGRKLTPAERTEQARQEAMRRESAQQQPIVGVVETHGGNVRPYLGKPAG